MGWTGRKLDNWKYHSIDDTLQAFRIVNYCLSDALSVEWASSNHNCRRIGTLKTRIYDPGLIPIISSPPRFTSRGQELTGLAAIAMDTKMLARHFADTRGGTVVLIRR